MYSVLIVDDEEPLIEAIRILGDWDNLRVTEIMEANNGKEGMALIREKKPDLILVDMKMPVMSGTEFLKLVNQEYPDIPIIVISGYNDFDYARQAIKSDAVDYLLKPVNKKELNHALGVAVAGIEQRRRERDVHIDREITLNMSLPKLKEKILISILENRFQSSPASLAMIGADDPRAQFGLAHIRIMNLKQILRDKFRDDTDLLYFSLTNVINEEVGDDKLNCFSFNHPKREQEIILLYTFDSSHRETIMFQSQSAIGRALSRLNTLFGIVAVAGLGGISTEIGQLPVAFHVADQVVNSMNLMFIHHNDVMVSYTISHGSSDNQSITGRISAIRHALEEGNLAYAEAIVAEYIGKFKHTGYYSIGMAGRTLGEFTLLLREIALDLGVTNEELAMGCEHELRTRGVTFDYVSFQQFEQLLNAILNYYGELIRRSIQTHQHFNIQDIKDYIHLHYAEEIRISIFTERYYLSREYLMKLFKQEYGSGIYEYVQKVRMEKAKELLMDPRIKIQDISEMLGYKDKNYFSKAFKNYYQQSPSDYRASRM